LPVTNGPAAQFLFERPDGTRLILYLRRETAPGVSLSYAVASDLPMYYCSATATFIRAGRRWLDAAARQHLLDAAAAVHNEIAR
jgi:hypothetical protein